MRAVRSCHDARRDRLAALADDLLDCYTAGRGDGAAKRALVDFVTAEVIEQITMEDEAFRPLAATPVGAGIIDALPAGPPLIRALVQEIADDRSDVTVAAATGALVMLMDARAAVENAVLLPALDKSPERVGTLDTLLSCCDQSTVVCQNRSEWWIG